MGKLFDYIFIDTSVFKQESFFKETGAVSKLLNLAKEGYVKVLLPVIIEKEWERHLLSELDIKFTEVERKMSLLGEHNHLKLFVENYNNVVNRYNNLIEDTFNAIMNSPGIEILDYDFFQDTMNQVFSKYFMKEKPFGSKGKSKEFPDAFALASLEKYASIKKISKIVILSNDQDMKEYASRYFEHREIKEYLDDLLVNRIKPCDERLKSDLKQIDDYIHIQNGHFQRMVRKRVLDYLYEAEMYESRFFYAEDLDVEDVDFDVDFSYKRLDVLSVTPAEIQAVCFPSVKGEVEVSVFDEEDSPWDSEEKEYIYKRYKCITIPVESSIKVVVKMNREELAMGQDPDISIVDVDFSYLQEIIDGD